MEIELDKIAFTAEVKEGLYAGSSFRGESSDHQGTCKEGSEEGVNCQGTWGDRRDSPSSSKVLSDSQFPRLPVLFQSLSSFLKILLVLHQCIETSVHGVGQSTQAACSMHRRGQEVSPFCWTVLKKKG